MSIIQIMKLLKLTIKSIKCFTLHKIYPTLPDVETIHTMHNRILFILVVGTKIKNHNQSKPPKRIPQKTTFLTELSLTLK